MELKTLLFSDHEQRDNNACNNSKDSQRKMAALQEDTVKSNTIVKPAMESEDLLKTQSWYYFVGESKAAVQI